MKKRVRVFQVQNAKRSGGACGNACVIDFLLRSANTTNAFVASIWALQDLQVASGLLHPHGGRGRSRIFAEKYTPQNYVYAKCKFLNV